MVIKHKRGIAASLNGGLVNRFVRLPRWMVLRFLLVTRTLRPEPFPRICCLLLPVSHSFHRFSKLSLGRPTCFAYPPFYVISCFPLRFCFNIFHSVPSLNWIPRISTLTPTDFLCLWSDVSSSFFLFDYYSWIQTPIRYRDQPKLVQNLQRPQTPQRIHI